MEDAAHSAINDGFRTTLYRDMYFEAFNNQAQYGRWILASLLAVHAGGLLAITQSGPLAAKLFAACGPYFLSGLSLALICGGLAWINFSVAMSVYARVLMAERQGQEHEPSRTVRVVIATTLWGTPSIAAASLGLFVMAANAALSTI